MVDNEHAGPRGRSLWWLSFVDRDLDPPPEQQRPGGPSFLGVCIVEASDMMSAVRRAHELGCNPGGEVKGFGPLPVDHIPVKYWDRVLTADEAKAVPNPWGSEAPETS